MARQAAVIGLGRAGWAAATTLADEGTPVIAVDKNEQVTADIDRLKKPNIVVVPGDATKEEFLKDAIIKDVDIVFVALSDFRDSVLTTLNLHKLGVKEIIVRASDDDHAKILKDVGATRVVFPERDTGVRVAHSMVASKAEVKDVIVFDPNVDYRIEEIAVSEKIKGKTLRELKLEHRFPELKILFVRSTEARKKEDSDEEERVSKRQLRPFDYKLREGDTVIIAGDEKSIKAVEKEIG